MAHIRREADRSSILLFATKKGSETRVFFILNEVLSLFFVYALYSNLLDLHNELSKNAVNDGSYPPGGGQKFDPSLRNTTSPSDR